MALTLVNGTLYDGTDRRRAGIWSSMGTVRLSAACATQECIDIAGLAVPPGFIDTHSHCDLVCISDRQLAPVAPGHNNRPARTGRLSESIKSEDVDRWRTHLSGLNDDPQLTDMA
jgi:predicted amidohydrolase YtcJ